MSYSFSPLSRREALKRTGVAGLAVTLSSRKTVGQTDDRRLWSFETDDAVRSSPTVVDGRVFFGSDDSYMYSIDTTTGDQEWKLNTGPASDVDVVQSPTVVDETVFFGAEGTTLYSVDVTTGDIIYTVKNGTFPTTATVVNNTVYSSANNYDYEDKSEGMLAIDAESGSVEWEIESSNPYGTPVVIDGTLFNVSTLYSDRKGKVSAIDPDTGEKKWEFEFSSFPSRAPTVADDTVYIGSDDGNLYAVDAETGEQQWAFNSGSEAQSRSPMSVPTIVNNTLLINSQKLYALDAATGEQQWSFGSHEFSQLSSPTVADGAVFVGINEKLYSIDIDSGTQRWSFSTGDFVVSSPTVFNGNVYFGSRDSKLYALNTDIDGSSEGSRVTLGTLGHHSEWQYANQSFRTSSPTEQEASPTPTPTDEPTTTDEPTPTANSTLSPTDKPTTTEGSTATSTETPGFGLGTVATALGTSLGLARVVSRLAGDDDTDQSDDD